ncbi:short chain dehydrogenase [Penicillium cinerascens]|uniref:Short chain dehydrogenase n=1 Tax=Penicillium cinerascens TaxID=70096 RepID=A0A9W9TBF7_9EURO|nr:short chain dehydrogenase [Penicillium cinerascens]KAJ5216259.1 short chain dehydrogenase [Penicillium cinerascens]
MTRHAIYPSLEGKVVLVTGGAEGIGAATVELFARQGSRVLFMDISKTSAQRTIDRIVSLPIEAGAPPIIAPVFHYCDITDLPAIQATTSKILEEYGVINILVNNAAATGSGARRSTAQVTPESWDFSVNSNFRHVFFLTQAVVPAMKSAGGGSIVNLGSITWRIPDPVQPVYAACKAAIMGLTRVQSKEVGADNIRINSVMPGAIATRRQREEILTPEYRHTVMRNQSLQRDLEPEEVAKVIVFLGSDEASAVTGKHPEDYTFGSLYPSKCVDIPRCISFDARASGVRQLAWYRKITIAVEPRSDPSLGRDNGVAG